MVAKKSNLPGLKEAFERQDAMDDKKKGMKEDGPADKKKDAKDFPAFLKKKGGK